MAFLKRITPYAIAGLVLAVFYVRVPPPLRKTPYEHLQTFSLYRADLPSVQETPYEYLMFVVQWPFAVCANKNCTYKSLPKNFTIHGIWPANNSGIHLNCTGKCFNLRQMDNEQKLQKDLGVSWPNLERNNNMIFWSHEYNNHGRCCDNVFKQTVYFKTAHNMWLRHRVEVMFKNDNYAPGQSYYPVELKAAVKKETKKDPALRCTNYTKDKTTILLLEVVICYDKDGKNVIDCPENANARCGTDRILWKDV